MKIVYHNDLDGKCSAAIVFLKRKKLMGKDDPVCTLIEMDYNRIFPFQVIEKDDLVYIVDFSLKSKEEWDKLLNITKNVVWIDHHKTALDKYKDLDLEGLRNIEQAGCELTWEYFYNVGSPMPWVVKYLADHDTGKFEYKGKTEAFQVGIQVFDTYPNSDNWKRWFRMSCGEVENIIRIGNNALLFRENQYKKIVDDWSFEIEFEGYKCIACNSHEHRSQLFDSINGNYDIMMPFVFDGKKYKVCMYTKREDLDVSEIAVKYGGGGHQKAAGFVCEELPFAN